MAHSKPSENTVGRPKKQYAEDMIRDICREFLNGDPAGCAAGILNGEWKERGLDYSVREYEVLRLVREGARRGYFVEAFAPHEELEQKVADRFGFHSTMVDVNKSNGSLEQVTRLAAEVVLAKIKQLDREVVRIGFGAGRSTERVAHALAQRMCSEGPLPKLVFHVLTKGFHMRQVSYDPMAFFSYFADIDRDVEFVGLPTPPLVPVDWDGDPATLVETVLGDPFAEKWDIDIIVTSLANYSDPSSEHRRLVQACGMAEEAEAKRVVGDVLYRSFNDHGEVEFESGRRAVTLFDLEELRRFAATPGKDVVLVSGPCGGEERTRHIALRPLLEKPELRVWSHIVTDMTTAQDLLRS